MAEARILASKIINEHYLVCEICFEPINDPRGLPCSHVFCCVCLKDWAAACGYDMNIKCPLCGKNVPIPDEGIEGFPADFRETDTRDTVDIHRKVTGFDLNSKDLSKVI